MASSKVSELLEGGFRHVIEDITIEDHSQVKRLILCTGKVFYDLQGHPRRTEANSTAIARMELLYPFPEAALEELLMRYPNLEKVFWMQEEPRTSICSPRQKDFPKIPVLFHISMRGLYFTC